MHNQSAFLLVAQNQKNIADVLVCDFLLFFENLIVFESKESN